MKQNVTIPIFYACDDRFARYMAVSIASMQENANNKRHYTAYILNAGLQDETKRLIQHLQTDWFQIVFVDVSHFLEAHEEHLPLRDYYSKTTYYRMYIAEMFPQYEKALYIDSDTVVLGDISELYDTELGDAYLAAAHEQAMVQTDVFGTYVEQVVGVDRNAFFNAGILVLNCKQFREKQLLKRFSDLLHVYNFAVTQDEDYLNVLCKDHVHWLEQKWNCELYGELLCTEQEIKIIHYIMVSKPWHYADCRFAAVFWEYAAMTPFHDLIRHELLSYTDEQKQADADSAERLAKLAQTETERDDGYLKVLRRSQAPDRVAVLERMAALESAGIFDLDVEDDPPARELLPDEIDYLHRGWRDRFMSKFSFGVANLYLRNLLRKKKMIFKGIVGIENFQALQSGAVITCNHFNALDSFAIQLAYYHSKQKKRKFYRVIREGNYTSFPGFYGLLMRHCNTLPLSSNLKTMGKFLNGVQTHLCDGHFVLVYPEQSMWWNYRKPKPLKAGAFRFAVKADVPVLPCFITMQDSDIPEGNGFFVQEYTIHIGKPIYPNPTLRPRARIEAVRVENERVWREIYESFYGMPLTYNTQIDAEDVVRFG